MRFQNIESNIKRKLKVLTILSMKVLIIFVSKLINSHKSSTYIVDFGLPEQNMNAELKMFLSQREV